MTATWPLGDAIRAAREARNWSLDEATFQARQQYPDLKLRRGKIHRYESALNTDRIDITVVAALCELYDIDLEEVDPELYAWWQAVKRLAGANSPWSDDPLPTSPIRPLVAA